MFVKICGTTSESDALIAVAMGADAVGFVFAPSPRQIAPQLARDIARRLPPEILTVGVFRDESPQRVVEVVNQMGLRGAQLHGRESPAEAKWVADRVPFVIKAFTPGDPLLDKIDDYPVHAVLLDASEPGSGRTFDWGLVEGVTFRHRVILAGGLTPENVGEAIERVQPWGVDVVSGVEASPGRKDVIALRAFVNAAKAYEDPDESFDPTNLGVGEIDQLAEELAEESEPYDFAWEDDADPLGAGGDETLDETVDETVDVDDVAFDEATGAIDDEVAAHDFGDEDLRADDDDELELFDDEDEDVDHDGAAGGRGAGYPA